MWCDEYKKMKGLRMLAMYEAKQKEISKFWTFWSIIQLINHLLKSRHTD